MGAGYSPGPRVHPLPAPGKIYQAFFRIAERGVQDSRADSAALEDSLNHAVRAAQDAREREGRLLAACFHFAVRCCANAHASAAELKVPSDLLPIVSGQRAGWYGQPAGAAVAHFRRAVVPWLRSLAQASPSRSAHDLRADLDHFSRFADLLRAALHERHLTVRPNAHVHFPLGCELSRCAEGEQRAGHGPAPARRRLPGTAPPKDGAHPPARRPHHGLFSGASVPVPPVDGAFCPLFFLSFHCLPSSFPSPSTLSLLNFLVRY